MMISCGYSIHARTPLDLSLFLTPPPAHITSATGATRLPLRIQVPGFIPVRSISGRHYELIRWFGGATDGLLCPDYYSVHIVDVALGCRGVYQFVHTGAAALLNLCCNRPTSGGLVWWPYR